MKRFLRIIAAWIVLLAAVSPAFAEDWQTDEAAQSGEEWDSEAELKQYGIAYQVEDSGITAEFDQPSYILRKSNSKTIVPKVNNYGGSIQYDYVSSDETVAKVSRNGTVKAVGLGKAVITCVVTTDGAEIQVNYLVTVVKAVKKIYSDLRDISMHSGEEQTPVLTYSPADASMCRVTWTSTDEAVAMVDQSGTIHANRVGLCMIIGTAADGCGAEVRIRVVVPRVSLSADEILIDDPYGADFSYWVNAAKKSVSLVTGCYEQCVKASGSTREVIEGVEELPVAEVKKTTIHLTPTEIGKDKYFVTANGHDYVVDIKVARTAVYLPVKCYGLGSRYKDSGQRYEITGTVVSVSGDDVRTLILQAAGEDEQYAECTVPADVAMADLGDAGDEVRIDGILNGRTQYVDENRHYHWVPKITAEKILPMDKNVDTGDDPSADEDNQDDEDLPWTDENGGTESSGSKDGPDEYGSGFGDGSTVSL